MQPTQLDPAVVNLTKAIRQTESGGNFQAKGASGEYGAYQFTPDTWNGKASKYGVNVPLNQATPEQQNEVAYKQIAEWKNQGYNVGQIASMWNAGPGKPNAYLEGNAGINKYGVSYDTAAYATKVATAYQGFKGQTPQNNSVTPEASTDTQDQSPSVGGFLNNAVSSVGNLLGGLGNAVMHPLDTVKNLGETALGGIEKLTSPDPTDNTQKFDNVATYFKNRYGGDSLSEIAGHIGNTFYTDPAGAALDLSTLLDGVGGIVEGAGKVGALDAGRAAELSKAADFISSAKGIIQSGTPEATQALMEPSTLSKVGAGLKTAAAYTNPLAPITKTVEAAANGISKLTDALPRRIINNLLPQLKTAGLKDYAIDNLKVGSVDKMLQTSQEALDNYDSQINTILKHPDNAGLSIVGSDIGSKTLSQFPNSEYTPESIFAKVKSQVPGSAKLVTKLQDGSLSLDEANTLRKAVDSASYKLTIDSPEVKAGKEVLNKFGNSLRDRVQTLAPETKPIFDGYAKEINLKKALVKLSQKSEKKGLVSTKELLEAIGAQGAAGPVVGAATLVGSKILDSTATKVATAKALNIAKIPIKAAAKGITKVAPFAKEAAIAGRISNISNQK